METDYNLQKIESLTNEIYDDIKAIVPGNYEYEDLLGKLNTIKYKHQLLGNHLFSLCFKRDMTDHLNKYNMCEEMLLEIETNLKKMKENL